MAVGWRDRLSAALGHERHLLMVAGEAEIAAVATGQLARAIVAQRTNVPGRVSAMRKDEPGGGRMNLPDLG